MKTRGRAYYQENRERQSKLANIRKRLNRSKGLALILLYKTNKPCSVCGKKYPPAAMDFDHRDPELKAGNVSELAGRGTCSLATVLREILKCDLVCANCHRLRTYGKAVRVEVRDALKKYKTELLLLMKSADLA